MTAKNVQEKTKFNLRTVNYQPDSGSYRNWFKIECMDGVRHFAH